MKRIERADLEKPRTKEEMCELEKAFQNRNIYSNEQVHLFTETPRMPKIMLEEYLPLKGVLDLFPGETKAHLTKESNDGPDAVIILKNGMEMTLQITTSYRSYNEALGREMLSKGEIVMRGRQRRRVGKLGSIEEFGRWLTTKEARASEIVAEIKSALDAKVQRFKLRTDALLICVENVSTIFPWIPPTLEMLSATADNPYKRVFVGDTRSTPINFSVR